MENLKQEIQDCEESIIQLKSILTNVSGKNPFWNLEATKQKLIDKENELKVLKTK